MTRFSALPLMALACFLLTNCAKPNSIDVALRVGGGTPGSGGNSGASQKPVSQLNDHDVHLLAFEELMKVRRPLKMAIQPPSGREDQGCIAYRTIPGIKFLRAYFNDCSYSILNGGHDFSWTFNGQELYERNEAQTAFVTTLEVLGDAAPKGYSFNFFTRHTRTLSAQKVTSTSSQTAPVSFDVSTEAERAWRDNVRNPFVKDLILETHGRWSLEPNGSLVLAPGALTMIHFQANPNGRGAKAWRLELTNESAVGFASGCHRPMGRFNWVIYDDQNKAERSGVLTTNALSFTDPASKVSHSWPKACVEF